jgi:hypothetical protein
MTKYVKAMVEEFLESLSGNPKCPWNENLFKVNDKLRKLHEAKVKVFHTFVMKGMFLCK